MLFDLVILGTDPAGLAVARRAVEMGQGVAVINDPVHFATSQSHKLEGKLGPGIRVFRGSARFKTPETVEVARSGQTELINARRFLLACGNRPKRPAHLPFDGEKILDCDEARARKSLPQPLLIVGAGEHGLRFASEQIERGVQVSLVDQSPQDIPIHIRRGTQVLPEQLRNALCPVQWGTTVLGVEKRRSLVTVYYDNGSIESYGGVVFAVGRVGCTEQLNLPRPDLLLDETSRVWCDETGQTGVPHLFAVGSVVGFPRFQGPPAQEAERILPHLFAEAVPPRPAFLRMEKLASR